MKNIVAQNYRLDKQSILFEDDAIIAIDKPADLLVIPDRWNVDKPNLLALLRQRDPVAKIYVVHRLDLDTSGVILFAKTAEAHRRLNQQLEARQVTKEYLAIVMGEIEKDGSIDLAVDSDPNRKGRMMVRSKGKASLTEYQVLERFKGFTLVKAIPRTGRTHQIRVHLRAIGHPLAIDPFYGSPEPIYLSKLKRNYRFKPDEPERPLMKRLTLHAAEINFQHPTTAKMTRIAAEPPKDMRGLLNSLRKYQSLPISKSCGFNLFC